PDQLLGLREELDFADAAAAGLDVMALDGDSSATSVSVDLPLDGVDVLDRSKIEVLAPDERLQLTQKAPPGDLVAGDWAGFDQCCSFPILANALIIGQRCRNGECGRSGRRIRAEPEIGAKNVAVGSSLAENASEIPR